MRALARETVWGAFDLHDTRPGRVASSNREVDAGPGALE